MQIIELITEIIQQAFLSSGDKSPALFDIADLSNETVDIVTIFKLCYNIIRRVIMEYRPNELYACQWIKLFMEHTMLSTDKSDILADEMLMELIDNNQLILQ